MRSPQENTPQQRASNGQDKDADNVHNGGAAEAINAVKDRTGKIAEEVKVEGADQVAGVSRAVHEAADRLGQALPQAASFIHSAADQLESASAALRERNVEDLVSSFTNFARRQPVAAFAGSVLAGFALSRFFKSSPLHA